MVLNELNKNCRNLRLSISRYENDEFTETLELDEWIGESWMLKNLCEEVENFKVVEFVN